MSAHVKTDPVCIHYKETGPFRRYLNERGRGKGCPACVPAYTSPWNLLGAAPDFTGGLSVDEHMDEQRGRNDD